MTETEPLKRFRVDDMQRFSSQLAMKSPSHALCGFSVRRTPRACHGACAHLRPGRLRASHAVCLRYSTLEPDTCARKEAANIESVSTIEWIRIELFAMRSLNPSFKTDSLCSSSASSTDFSDSLPHPLRSEKRLTMALQRTAPGGSACHAGCSPQIPPRSQRATRRLAPQSLSLGSLAV